MYLAGMYTKLPFDPDFEFQNLKIEILKISYKTDLNQPIFRKRK